MEQDGPYETDDGFSTEENSIHEKDDADQAGGQENGIKEDSINKDILNEKNTAGEADTYEETDRKEVSE